MLYALLGAAFAFNIRGVSDRAAEAYRGKPWLLRQIGRDNAAAWRAGGLIMVAFGVAMIRAEPNVGLRAGILLIGLWNPPGISVTAAIVILIAAAVVSTVMLVRSRQNRQPHQSPEGR